MRIKLLIIALVITCNIVNNVHSAGLPGRMDVGLNYPGVTFRYGLTSKIALQGKAQFGSGVTVIGPRAYYYLSSHEYERVAFEYTSVKERVDFYVGPELDLIIFEGDESSGMGFAAGAFGGFEYYFIRNMTFGMDMGPVIVSIVDSDTKESVTSFNIILNAALNYYFL